MWTGSELVLTLVSLPFQTCSPSSSPLVSGPSFSAVRDALPRVGGRGDSCLTRAGPGLAQNQPRPPAPMWKSSSSPNSGACASATSARVAQQAASPGSGALTPPRPTPPSRSMATRDQGQFASPWSPRTPLTGLTPMSWWGKTAGMASMRPSSARTAASTGELPTASRAWAARREDRGRGSCVPVTVLLLSGHRAKFLTACSVPTSASRFLCLKIICACTQVQMNSMG